MMKKKKPEKVEAPDGNKTAEREAHRKAIADALKAAARDRIAKVKLRKPGDQK